MDPTERRTEKISVSLPPTELARLEAFAAANDWSRSTAIMVLIRRGLERESAAELARGA